MDISYQTKGFLPDHTVDLENIIMFFRCAWIRGWLPSKLENGVHQGICPELIAEMLAFMLHPSDWMILEHGSSGVMSDVLLLIGKFYESLNLDGSFSDQPAKGAVRLVYRSILRHDSPEGLVMLNKYITEAPVHTISIPLENGLGIQWVSQKIDEHGQLITVKNGCTNTIVGSMSTLDWYKNDTLHGVSVIADKTTDRVISRSLHLNGILVGHREWDPDGTLSTELDGPTGKLSGIRRGNIKNEGEYHFRLVEQLQNGNVVNKKFQCLELPEWYTEWNQSGILIQTACLVKDYVTSTEIPCNQVYDSPSDGFVIKHLNDNLFFKWYRPEFQVMNNVYYNPDGTELARVSKISANTYEYVRDGYCKAVRSRDGSFTISRVDTHEVVGHGSDGSTTYVVNESVRPYTSNMVPIILHYYIN